MYMHVCSITTILLYSISDCSPGLKSRCIISLNKVFSCPIYRSLSSSRPQLNYIIGIGALMLYVDIYLSVMPATDRSTASVLCNVRNKLQESTYMEAT